MNFGRVVLRNRQWIFLGLAGEAVIRRLMSQKLVLGLSPERTVLVRLFGYVA